jgi:3-deoxy-manno-octulosonate cytidylyltransferase (CMP-KDO synthetase)
MMTRSDHKSGTDRVAEIAAGLDDVDIVVNLQGDEPEISGDSIDLTVELLEHNSDVPMATLAVPIRDRSRLDDPACVKVVLSDQSRALYFSRATVPFAREWTDELLTAEPPRFLQHVGVYAYRRSFLLHFAQMPQSSLEQLEKLEQLRVIQAGIPIQVGIIGESVNGIDTPEDYRRFVTSCRT